MEDSGVSHTAIAEWSCTPLYMRKNLLIACIQKRIVLDYARGLSAFEPEKINDFAFSHKRQGMGIKIWKTNDGLDLEEEVQRWLLAFFL
jgi:hypothetical protein